ncbi:MAG: aminotransferase class I/II-fold pyridoxal phosphate-dependent enzyme [Bacteroidales bacterium]|nr:aminotransferase class I/II-fold pyridoxal phosphate-dependent enzyme [Bacteroidales bacterium]MBP5635331.1 aminotransferase class I/II-fold pyridoxal phosphate-dependent enzyme [Bacteroidales bacterium]
MKRFDSDYLEGCLPQILERLAQTNLEQTPGYGEDPHCARAAELIRRACGNDALQVHFLVGGTQANVTVISALLRPHQGVLCAESGHINVHETGAVEHSGHKALALPSPDGKIRAAQIRDAIRDHYDDFSHEHMSQPGMVYISFPTEKGTLYTLAELKDIAAACREARIPLFIDGARLGYGLASPACDVRLEDIAALADVFYIGGTKQGALFGEAVVFRTTELARDFRYNIKQNGGMLAKGRLLGIQFEVLFEDGLYLRAARHAAEQAFRIRDAFRARGASFLVESPTNQQFPILANDEIARLRERFSFESWQKIDDSHTAVRFVTSWATPDANVDALVAAIGENR